MAYNSAVKGCSTWECPDDLVSDLFDISREVRLMFLAPSSMIIEGKGFLDDSSFFLLLAS